MPTPLRIKRYYPKPGAEAISPNNAVGSTEMKDYLSRLVKMIPSEVIGLYMIGSGIIPSTERIGLTVWSCICLILVVVVRVWGTSDKARNIPTEWPVVVISTIAFIIWLYWLGGPFKVYDIQQPWIASCAVLVWSFVIPVFYKED